MMHAQNETAPFVDLYDLLDLPPGSDVATVRKRITTLYIEAQNNLDHRNFRKRFYYQGVVRNISAAGAPLAAKRRASRRSITSNCKRTMLTLPAPNCASTNRHRNPT
jgi:hypothetical protein